jgi:cytochrome c-type biogenesis protein CcmH/NrfF
MDLKFLRRRPLLEGVATSRRGEGARRYPGLLMVLGLLAVQAVFAGALAGQRHQDRPGALEAERAIAQLRSPYCPGLMLEICPSAPAAALRDSIYELAAAGAMANELVEWMLERHGEEYRGVPQRSGAGIWAWVMPPIALLVGIGLLLSWLRARNSPAAADATPAISEEERSELTAALRDWEATAEEDS